MVGLALDLQFTAQCARDFAADGKAQAGATVFAAGGAVGLLEGFKDDALLVFRDADAAVVDGNGQHLAGLVQVFVADVPPALGPIDAHLHGTGGGLVPA